MSCPFIKFKDDLGVPGTGLHKFKILDTSMFDYWFTIVLSYIWAYVSGMPLVLSTIMWYVIGLILHILFGVPTKLVKYLNVSC